MLLLQDPQLDQKFRLVVRDTTLDSHMRFRALVYLIYLTKDDNAARTVMQEELNESPELSQDDAIGQLMTEVREQGWLDFSDTA